MALPNLRDEIAYAAARMIAEDGLDYSTAKRKAVRQLLGQSSPPRGELMPDNSHIEAALREYLTLYMGDTQPQRLRALREAAVELMTWLERFDPYLTGAVWNGTAGEHSEIVIQCFTDSAKDVAIFLLNADIDFDTEERQGFTGRGLVEAMHFERLGEDVTVVVYDRVALRGALRPGPDGRTDRGDVRAVRRLLEAESQDSDAA